MSEADDYVPIVFARNIAEAEFYKVLLEDHDISAIINESADDDDDEYSESGQGISVLVPSEQLDEAELVLEQRNEIDDDFDEEADEQDEEDEDYQDFEEIDPGEAIDMDDEEDIL